MREVVACKTANSSPELDREESDLIAVWDVVQHSAIEPHGYLAGLPCPVTERLKLHRCRGAMLAAGGGLLQHGPKSKFSGAGPVDSIR